MKKILKITIWVMPAILLIFATLAAIQLLHRRISSREQRVDKAIHALSELCYFEGQKDYASGDIRIKKIDGEWVWTKSPWDNDTTMKDWAKSEEDVLSIING